jgi:hypothetical protein
MNSLNSQIQEAAACLAQAMDLPRLALSHPDSCALPTDCYTLWCTRIEDLQHPLEATEKLLDTRDAASSVVARLERDAASVAPDAATVRFASQDMSFELARHLAVAAYLTTTWTIYDRLANVCGRLIGTDSVGDAAGPRSNPKLCEHFLTGRGDKDKHKVLHGFSLAKLLPAYAWPAKASYALRNWMTHEGQELEGISLFVGSSPSAGFTLHERATERITNDLAQENTPPHSCCLTDDPHFPWYDRNIMTVLERYHAEVDTMLAGMVRWSVNSFVEQITWFSDRDRGQLTAVAATTTTTTTTTTT